MTVRLCPDDDEWETIEMMRGDQLSVWPGDLAADYVMSGALVRSFPRLRVFQPRELIPMHDWYDPHYPRFPRPASKW